MSLWPLLLTSVVSVLLAVALPGARRCAGADEQSADGNAAEALRFRRVYAPADRVKDWPFGKVKYMRVEPAEFERLLKIAQSTTSGSRALLAARTVTAQYEARLVGEQLAAGWGSLRVIHSAAASTFMPLDPCSLAIDKAHWAGEKPPPATLGSGVDGKSQVLVEDSGQLEFEWSLAGRRDAEDVLNFQFELPTCPANRLILDLPADTIPATDHGLVSQTRWVDERIRRWQIELGGHHRFRLRVLPAGAAQRQRQVPLVRESIEYHLSLRGLDVLAELKLETYNGPLQQVTLALDRPLQLISARYGDASIPWSVTSADGKPVTQIALTLPESIRDTERVLQLRALAPLTADRRWRLPRIRPEGVVWQEGTATLLVPAPLVLKRLVPVGCRQTRTGPLSGPREGESAQFQYSTPGATVEIILSHRRAPLQLASGTEVELTDRGMIARVVADFSVSEDPRFSLEADVSRRWLIDSVESFPPEAMDDWGPAKPSGGRRKLSIRLAESLSPSRPVRLVINARRLHSPLGRELAVDDLVPLRFLAPPESIRLVAVRAAGPRQLRLSGAERLNRIDPRSLDAAQRKLFAELPDDLLFQNDSAAAELRISLESREPDDVPQPPEVAVTVSGSRDPSTPSAWAWDCQLESRYAADGTGRHRARYRLQNYGRRTMQLDLPRPVKPKDVHDVMVGRDRVSLQRTSQRKNRLSVDLPPRDEFPTVSVVFSTPPAPLGTIGSLGPPLPDVNLPVLSRHWIVRLPPGYEATGADALRRSSSGAQLGWSRRLLGPLGRAAGEAAFDPLAAITRLFAPAATPERMPLPVEARQGQRAEPKATWTDARWAEQGPADSHDWNTYHLQISGTSPGRLHFVHRQNVRMLGAVTFLLAVALGWWMAGHRPVVLTLLVGVFGVAATVLPEPYVPVASGAVLGTLFCLAYRLIRTRRAVRHAPPDSAASTDPSRTRPSEDSYVCPFDGKATTLLGVLVFVAAAGGSVRAPSFGAQAGSESRAPAAVVHRVFIPVDRNEEPTGEKYYVPHELYVQLHRRGAVATEKPHECLITTATYRGAVSRETTSERLVVEELKAEFTLQVFDATARVRIPLGREGANLLPGGALLDSRPIQPEWEADGSGLLLEVPQPGEYRLELSLRPTLRTGLPSAVHFDDPPKGRSAGFDLNIPRLASSRLELTVPPGLATIRVPSAAGMVRFDDEVPRMVAELGPSDRLSVRWPDGIARAATRSAVDIEELLWMKIQPGSVVLDAKLKFKIPQGQARPTNGATLRAPPVVRLAVDPRLQLLPLAGDDPPAVEVRRLPGQPQMLILRWPGPIADQVVLNARFILTGTSGVGNLRLPQLRVLDARSTRRWLAVSVDPALEHQQQPSDGLEAVAVPDFLNSWGPSESQLLFAYRLPHGEIAWNMSTRLCEPQIDVEQTLAVSIDRENASVQYDAELAPVAGYIFQHRLRGPAALRVEEVSVLENGAERAARWSQDRRGIITVFLTELMAGPQRLSLRGSIPTGGKRMRLPVLQVDAGKLKSSTIELFRRPAVLAKLTQADGLVPLEDSVTDAPDPARSGVSEDPTPIHRRGRLIGRFRAQGERPIKAALTLAPNRPKVRAEQVTRLRHSDGSWTAEIDCRLHVTGGLLDEIRLDAPSPLGAPLQISPAAALRLIDTPGHSVGDRRSPADGRPRQLIVRPSEAIEGDYQFTVCGPLKFASGDRPAAPRVSLRKMDQLKRFLALPKHADDQPMEWKRQGLKETRLPEGLATPTDAETLATYEIVDEAFQAILSRDRPRKAASVRLADVRIVWQADRKCVGMAAFDLEPGGSSDVPLQMASRYELIHVSVAGAPAEAVPQPLVRGSPDPAPRTRWHGQETGHNATPAGRSGWRVPLDPGSRPQRIEVLFSGELPGPASAADRSLDAPTLGNLAVGQTLWTVVGPSSFEPGQPEDRSLIGSRPHELSRLKSAAALIESASALPAEELQDTLRWYRPWARRLAAARAALQNRPALDGPSKRAWEEELDAIDRQQSQIAERLGVTNVYQWLMQDDAPAAAGNAPQQWSVAELWQRSLARGQDATRCTISGRSDTLTLSYGRGQPTGLPYRLAGAAGLVGLIVLAVLGLRRGILVEWFKRWPQAIGVAAGLAWWLWLSPSILGLGIVLVSLTASLLPGWKYSPPAPGSSVISLRTRQR